MNIKTVLEFRENTESGVCGWLPEQCPYFFDPTELGDYRDNFLLCHDILEHDLKNDDGSVEAELMALGAAIYGRLNHGLGNITDYGVKSDIIDNARESNLYIKKIKNGKRKFDEVEWFIDYLKESKIISEILDNFYDTDGHTRQDVENWLKIAYQYIRIGARRTKNRFKSGFNLISIFDDLARKLSSVKYADEWDKIKININTNTRKVDVVLLPYSFEDTY